MRPCRWAKHFDGSLRPRFRQVLRSCRRFPNRSQLPGQILECGPPLNYQTRLPEPRRRVPINPGYDHQIRVDPRLYLPGRRRDQHTRVIAAMGWIGWNLGQTSRNIA